MARITKYELRERAKVLEAYGHRCAACGFGLDLEQDHVHPRNAGGDDSADNLQILCHHCNNRKNGAVGIPKLDPITLTAVEREILEAAEMLIREKRDAFISYLDECKRLAR